ncbi:hypothetical protein RUM43_006448 [Polyplax serrata]|uniref:Dynein heavy chain n=1 Tax=Polyplax serrata TaxID=468196 RepID=A0AAN8P1D3_POLSC
MTRLQGKPSPSGYPFEQVHTYVLNPKSITMGQLYGEFDLMTHEWTDGILPSLVRIGTASENLDKHWYVFDGPVDAVWIENMNTVLDDNKKLCLTSGEIIKLTEAQTMMFEVADLAVASPATVSRCGMVYLEPGVLGLQPFVNCWFRKLPKHAEPLIEQMNDAFNKYLFPALDLLRTSMREIVASIDSAIVTTFLHQMDIRFRPLTNPDGKPLPQKQFLASLPNLVIPFVLYSLVWSVGSTCDNASRIVFSEWLKGKVIEYNHEPKFPSAGIVHDYRLHDGGFSDPVDEAEPIPPHWVHWMADMEQFKVSPDLKYSDIEVPTVDNIRNSWQMGLLLNNYNNVLCIGPTGTGKTLTVAAKLARGMHKKFISDFIVFSARTSANQTQDLIDSKLDKRRRNVYGPPPTRRQIFFIDDLNMPALETYGAQPPIELIRQWMDFSGWYDRKEIGTFRTIIDTNFVAAMGPPGGGRNPITARLMRHFKYIAFTELEDDSKLVIFGAIVDSWMSRTSNLKDMTEQFVRQTIRVYTVLLSEMLPTPAKTHYTFNLRDLSKVFQGVLMVSPDTINTLPSLLNLWYHENCRVFQDRLVSQSDRDWFDNLMKKVIEDSFRVPSSEVLDTEVIIYADCCSDSRNYERVTDFQKLQTTLEEYLEDYNTRTTAPMKLVLFLDALSHVCKISRVVRQPLGNALLLGMGGSGRQSLSKLAAHVSELMLFQIELSKSYGMSDWRDDVKNIMLRSGMENRESVFLFSDTQIKLESFLEDLNSILNSGDVPNIYASDELDKIYGAMRGPVQEAGLQTTKSNLFATYCKFVRSNLHCVLTMSPIGEIFRARLRQFPALVNCCTIDWFFPWPDSALQSVALRFLNEVDDLEVEEDILNGIVTTCQFMHQSVVDMSHKFLAQLNRHNYVTPTLYLELLASYSLLLKKKKLELIMAIRRLKTGNLALFGILDIDEQCHMLTGLDKMQTTAEEVKVLEAELYVLKPHLEKAAKEAAEMIEKIAADTKIAEETKASVAKDEAIASKVKEEAQIISDDAQKDLDEALPALEAAEKSLQALNKGDIGEVKALKTPPVGVITVIETICIIKGIAPKKVPGAALGTKVNDYWEPGKKMMADPGQFLVSLLNFDKDSITEDMIQKLEPYINDPNFQPAKIIKVSKACTSLCMWVHAMYKFYFINLVVAPKKAALKEANAKLAAVQKVLDAAKIKMAEILKGLAKLESKLKETEKNKAILESNAKLCEDRMDRAFRLINGLADEKERWVQTVDKYNKGLINIVGDILICSGAIAYLAPFTDAFRRQLLTMWGEQIHKYEIPHTPKCDPVSVLGDPILIRQWQIYGLPRDFLSVENGVLVANSKRWPLFIDPQGQANRWIRNMGKEHGMTVSKLTDKDLIRTLEAAIRFGKPCLIENVGTELDPALDSVLLRQVFKQAGTWVLKLGDTIIPYNNDFRLYLTTKLANPHYTPEVSIKVLLINFALVPSGLQDQLLALVVMQERPDLEEARSMIVVSSAQMNQELQEIEDRILYKLSVSEGSPVDDTDLIQTLEASKLKSEEIKQKVQAAEVTQEEIDRTRALYIPVANRAQILFFCLVDMASVDPMYQYSMDWFVNIFVNSMANTEKTGEIDTRIVTINDYFTFSLYANVCRSLFEKHKLLFAFLVCIRILLDKGDIDPDEYQFLLAGGVAKRRYENPAPYWISERSWLEITSLDNLPRFEAMVYTFHSNLEGFKRIFDSLEPHRHLYPKPWDTKLDSFQKIIVLKCLRPDKVTNAMQDFLAERLGQQFIEPVTSDLQAMYKESTPFNPLIFVLSAGTDPAAELYKFADRMKMTKRFETISLGQGQGPIAEKMMLAALESGSWVYFQNCHLAPSWMPRLERLIESINADSVHKEFRLWLTSTPSPHFPVSILQNGSKMTVEPPRGIKANLLKAYLSQVTEFNEYFHSEGERVSIFKWLLFSLCLFHGVCLERRKFGPLGFNIPYEFTDGDLRICISQLHMFLLEYADIPFKVLTYTAGQINYGGRVTDDWDRRCIMNILSDYYNIKVCNPSYNFDDKKFYHQLAKETTLVEYLAYIRGLPLNDDPSLFGLHANADISCAQAETFKALNTLLSLQPKVAGGESASQEEVTSKLAMSILGKIPSSIDLQKALQKYPVLYEESLNTVLTQEIIRYNKLLNVIQTTSRDLLKALKGLVVMSAKLEDMAQSMFNQKVPGAWSSKAYPSLKPLGKY